MATLAAFEWAVDGVGSPFQGAEKVEKKFAYFVAHKDEYDCVFVGSSRVMNQLSPAAFDGQLAADGRVCRSFNLGYAAMFLPECSFLIEQIRALHPARLRGVVIELSSPVPRHDLDDPVTERDVYWHRLKPTLLACAAVLNDADARDTTGQRVAQLWLQVSLFARCETHLGYGPSLLAAMRKSSARRSQMHEWPGDVIGPARDGFVPITHTLGQGEAGVAKTGGSTPDLLLFEKSVAELRVEIARPPGPPSCPAAVAVLRKLLGRQVAALKSSRIRPFFFIGPGTTREQTFLDLRADGTLPELAAFNDPGAHPDLYALEWRADRNHLNATGAGQLSQQLAQALAASGFPAPARPPR